MKPAQNRIEKGPMECRSRPEKAGGPIMRGGIDLRLGGTGSKRALKGFEKLGAKKVISSNPSRAVGTPALT